MFLYTHLYLYYFLITYIQQQFQHTDTDMQSQQDKLFIINKQTITSAFLGAGLALLSYFAYRKIKQLQADQKQKQKSKNKSLINCIGNTPLIYLKKLSAVLNCQIYAKLQYISPFGSSKDRAVKYMLDKIIEEAKLNNIEVKEIVEASSGSTAISLVQICKIYGIKVTLFLPDDLSQDKYLYLQTLGANIIKLPQVSIVDPNHYFNKAKQYSVKNKAHFLNQFDNLYNMQVHYKQTGPQIMNKLNKIDAFVCSAGTGGTIAGISKYLNQVTFQRIEVILADPQGSGLHAKIKYGALFTIQEREGYRLKNPFDTVIEGVGLNRPTKNFDNAQINDSYKIKDIEALHMAHYLIENEGLCVGGSSALNLCAVVKYCREHPKSKVVTILHDSGVRYLKKFYNPVYLKEKNIVFQARKEYKPQNLDFIQ